MVGPLPSYKLKLVLGVVPMSGKESYSKEGFGGGRRKQHGAKDVEAWKKLLIDRELPVEEAAGLTSTPPALRLAQFQMAPK